MGNSSLAVAVGQIMQNAPEDMKRFAQLSRAEQIAEIVHDCNAEIDDEGMARLRCDICHGKGVVYYADGDNWKTRECTCMKARRALAYVENAGLLELMRRSTFEKFQPVDEFTAELKKTVLEYLRASEGEWLYIGGQSGCGKTHLAMAVFGQMIKRHLSARVMMWIQDSAELKSHVNDDSYDREIRSLQTCDVLIIDDLWNVKPTEADIKLTRSIIDYRYINNLPTVITSEMLIDDMYQIDDAVAGRICEMCGRFLIQVAEDENKNYRMREVNGQ